MPTTIIDPFKPASVLLKAKDDKTGELLAGSTVNIGRGFKTILTLTTGSDGTASTLLPINSRTRSDFWVKQVKAPAGYEIYKPAKAFKAKPGDAVTVTVPNAKKTSGTTPAPNSSEEPSDEPTTDTSTPSTPAPEQGDSPASSSTAPADAPVAGDTALSSTAPAPKGSLAHTGADATPWLLGGAGILLAAGGGAVFATRRRRTEHGGDSPQD
ncbi:LAETG motif-containing sortase-dependent surface protein [Streptomyces plumbiresistens]|uniref:SpaA-like prealbumin fold domain-containing protein n=1 Tax=Streptomyces plumbiresistens TaxID=511811 RepID=A0ABP7SBZ8_9ACTN